MFFRKKKEKKTKTRILMDLKFQYAPTREACVHSLILQESYIAPFTITTTRFD